LESSRGSRDIRKSMSLVGSLAMKYAPSNEGVAIDEWVVPTCCL
jgi:hypothetical protein